MTKTKAREFPGAKAAQLAWGLSGRIYRPAVSGVAQRIRDAKAASENPTASTPRKSNTYRSNRLPRANIRGVHPHQLPRAAVDRSQYLPHQGARECARRVRQGVAGSVAAS